MSSPASGAPGRRLSVSPALWGACSIAAAVLATRATFALHRFALEAPGLPLWDEAKYGLDGARLAAAARALDLPRFAALVWGMDDWPPLFPLTEAPVFLLFGPSVAAGRGFVAILFLLLVAAVLWAGREIAPESPAVAVVATALAISSPMLQLFGAQTMLEVPGTVRYALALAVYARALRVDTRPAWYAAGFVAGALFFTKYNYGLLWLVPLAASEAWIACNGPVAALRDGAATLRRIDLRRPWNAFVAVYLALLAIVVVSGGVSFELGGREVSVSSIGNPLQLLALLAILRWSLRPRRSFTRFREWERGLAVRHRALLRMAALPAALWVVLPPHLRNFADFVVNRSGPSPLSPSSLLFYPRVFVEEYHRMPLPGVAVAVAVIAAAAQVGSRRITPATRALLFAVIAGIAATALHPYKEPRFLFVVAPALWLAAAWAVALGARRLLTAARLPALAADVVLALAALVPLALAPSLAPGLAGSFARLVAVPGTAPGVDRVVELAIARPTLVLGTWNQVSPQLLEWRFRERYPDAGAPPETAVPSRRGGGAERVLSRLRSDHGIDAVALLELEPGRAPSPEWAAAFVEETRWLEPVRAALDAGETPFAAAAEERFEGSPYRLVIYRRVRTLPVS